MKPGLYCASVPSVRDDAPVAAHHYSTVDIATLNFRPSCTDQHVPHQETAAQLADESCTDGLLTEEEPLDAGGNAERLRREGLPGAPCTNTNEHGCMSVLCIGKSFF